MRSQLNEIMTQVSTPEEERAKPVPFSKMPTAPVDEPWSFNNEERDEVLGEPPNWGRYRKAHLYYDQETPELYSAYKLPIAKMREGKLTVFFRGVQAALAALNGARGGVDIDPEFREPIYRAIKKYYALFDKEPPPLRSELNSEKPMKEEIKMEPEEVRSEEEMVEQNIDSVPDAPEKQEQRAVENDSSTEDSVNDKNKALETFDKNEYDVQNAVSDVTDNSVNSANTQQMSGDTMTENDLAKIAELMQRAVAPLTERVNALEASPQKEEVKPEVRSEPEFTEVEKELQLRLQKAESMIQRLVKNPIRRGRHGQMDFEKLSVTANDFYSRSASDARQEGFSALPQVVAENANELALDHEDSKLNKRHVLNILKQGLRAAAMDGLLTMPSSDWS